MLDTLLSRSPSITGIFSICIISSRMSTNKNTHTQEPATNWHFYSDFSLPQLSQCLSNNTPSTALNTSCFLAHLPVTVHIHDTHNSGTHKSHLCVMAVSGIFAAVSPSASEFQVHKLGTSLSTPLDLWSPWWALSAYVWENLLAYSSLTTCSI